MKYATFFLISQKAKRPVKSISATDILAAGEGIDKEKLCRNAYSEVLYIDIKL